MELLNELWEEQDKNTRHIVSGLAQSKKDRHINNFNNLYIKFIDTNQVNKSLDWGCGGGLLTKQLQEFSNEVHCVDVSTKSIDSCVKYTNPTQTYLLETSPQELDLPKVDLVLANAIVWHFPSLQYFKDVVSKWVGLSPKYIIFNSKKLKATKETTNYKKDFLSALYLNDQDVIDLFDSHEYKIISSLTSNNTRIPVTYFVFEKK